jgi:hypothetical protein
MMEFLMEDYIKGVTIILTLVLSLNLIYGDKEVGFLNMLLTTVFVAITFPVWVTIAGLIIVGVCILIVLGVGVWSLKQILILAFKLRGGA